jgi:hypothetical protein
MTRQDSSDLIAWKDCSPGTPPSVAIRREEIGLEHVIQGDRQADACDVARGDVFFRINCKAIRAPASKEWFRDAGGDCVEFHKRFGPLMGFLGGPRCQIAIQYNR